jgi:hypothetical protein
VGAELDIVQLNYEKFPNFWSNRLLAGEVKGKSCFNVGWHRRANRMIRSFLQKDFQYVMEAHIRIDRDEYNYDDSSAACITDEVKQEKNLRQEIER